MSYSFQVRAGTKAEAKQAVVSQFDAIVANQPVHEVDRDAAAAAATAFIDMLGEPQDGATVNVSVNGYLTWREEGDYTSANVTVSASLKNAE